MSEAYRDLSLDQALERRAQIEDQYWTLMDQLAANRDDHARISQYIYKVIQQGLQEE